jgi:hypothetical protein
MDVKNLKKKNTQTKRLRLLPQVCGFHKENRIL